jgi:hypothetical protein
MEEDCYERVDRQNFVSKTIVILVSLYERKD